MDKSILVVDTPKNCRECCFCGDIQRIYSDKENYKEIARCLLVEEINSVWRNIFWLMNNKEDWCPLKPIPKNDNNSYIADWNCGYKKGRNDCIKEIVKNNLRGSER